jgi:hypothetical protein
MIVRYCHSVARVLVLGGGAFLHRFPMYTFKVLFNCDATYLFIMIFTEPVFEVLLKV